MDFIIFDLHSFMAFTLEWVNNFVIMSFDFLNSLDFALIKDVVRMSKAYWVGWILLIWK